MHTRQIQESHNNHFHHAIGNKNHHWYTVQAYYHVAQRKVELDMVHLIGHYMQRDKSVYLSVCSDELKLKIAHR